MGEPGFKQDEPMQKWGGWDLAAWKLLPELFGGGKPYIRRFKNAWVTHNKDTIRAVATRFRFPSELLAGVCWIEVGGDPTFVDQVAFAARAIDWSAGPAVDSNLTVLKNPTLTSFGSVSIQLRTAAETLGLDASKMSYSELRTLAMAIEQDTYNIEIVGMHLRKLIDHDGLQKTTTTLSMEDIKIIGARYNRGTGLSLEKIKQNTKYGNFIVDHWQEFADLLE